MNEYIIKIIFYNDGKNDNIMNFSRTHKCRQWLQYSYRTKTYNFVLANIEVLLVVKVFIVPKIIVRIESFPCTYTMFSINSSVDIRLIIVKNMDTSIKRMNNII